MKSGIAFVSWDWALLCDENDLCLKPTEKKTKQDQILYHLPHLVPPELLKNWSLLCWKSSSQPLQKKKKNRLEADAFKTELHTSIARGKLSLVFLTMTSQYQPHMWFSPSALVCSSWSACLWTHVIRHGHLTLFNSSLQHLCATIKVYPLLRIVNHSR